MTVAAFRADGYATTSVDLTQRSVWVTNGEKFMVGRVNRQIDELDSAALTDSAAIDVLQQDDTVVVVDDTAHQARLLDTANVTLGGRLTLPGERRGRAGRRSNSRSPIRPPVRCGFAGRRRRSAPAT